jgi:two-component system sensor histidine kinase HydH
VDIRTQSALLASIVAIALGLSMLLRSGRGRATTLYSLFALLVGGFYLASFFHQLVPADHHPWVMRITLGAELFIAALVPSAALGFFLEFLGGRPRSFRVGRRVTVLSVAIGLGVSLTPLARELWAQVAVGAWTFGALLGSLSLLVRRMRQSESRIERIRLMYLAIGAAVAIVFALLHVLPWFGALSSVGPVASTFYLFFLAQTLSRLRLMDLHELLGKVAAQTVLAAMLALVFSALTAWVQHNPSLFLFNTLLSAFVMLILIEPLRDKVEEQVVRIFFRERFELLYSLTHLRARMGSVIDVREISSLVLDTLLESRRVTHASIFLLAEDRPGFRLLEHRGPAPSPFLDGAAARHLLQAAAGGQKALLLENLERRIAEMRVQSGENKGEGKRLRDELRRLNDTRAALQQMKAGICVPLSGNDRVIGFLNLWDERVPEAFASDEIALTLEIAERLATVIENSKLYERMREKDRLAALGEMAAGLAHEIRNPLGAIKGAAQCLDPKRHIGEDGEFLEVIVEEVNRLNGVVTQFLDYARPLKQSFGPTDLNEVVTRTVKLIQTDVPPRLELKTELAENSPKVSADAEQLKQVLINLVQNAAQAIGEASGRIVIRTGGTERFSDFRSGSDMVSLEVIDNGPGIPVDQQTHIFVPFFTTKQKGTGLGLAICQRIVKNHGGSISVSSRSGEGTTFTIRLPALPSELPEPLPEGTPFPGTLVAPAPIAPAPVAQTKPDRKRRRARN